MKLSRIWKERKETLSPIDGSDRSAPYINIFFGVMRSVTVAAIQSDRKVGHNSDKTSGKELQGGAEKINMPIVTMTLSSANQFQ